MGSKRNPTEFPGYKSKIDITFTKANKMNDGKAGRLFQAQREVKLQECTPIGVTQVGFQAWSPL